VPAVKSALQRARATLHEHRTGRETAPAPPATDQRRLLQAFITAHEQADPEALIALLRDDIRLAISPQIGEWNGRDQVAAALRRGMTSLGAWRVLPTAANGHPAAAGYLRRPKQTAFLPFVISVLDIQPGGLVDIAAFEAPDLITTFGLRAHL
jgi:RNA polymerase sigma-70 factor (ECF subfamily)